MRHFFFKKQIRSTRPAALIGLLLIIVLLVSTAVLVSIHVKDREQREMLIKEIHEHRNTLDQLQAALARKDLKKAFTELASARKSMDDLLARVPIPDSRPEIALKQKAAAPAAATPPEDGQPAKAPAPETASVKTTSAIAPSAPTFGADESPYPLVLAEKGEYLLVAEKDQKNLHLFRNIEGRFVFEKSYPCIFGANDLDKKRAGDLATPLGAYFLLRFIPGANLPAEYGQGAFVLNYPNFLDRKARKDGNGIWLHGHDPSKNLGSPELQNTRGCIVVSNEAIKELSGLLQPNGVPIVVVSRLHSVKASHQRLLAEELGVFMRSWARAWESGNTNRFMTHYASDFINSDGMTYSAFKRQKENVNRGKKFIRVGIEKSVILLHPENNAQTAIIRFTQQYRSSNFTSASRKIFYLKKGEAGWRIIGESRL
jgi:murein L,D-transpeptidase YafK